MRKRKSAGLQAVHVYGPQSNLGNDMLQKYLLVAAGTSRILRLMCFAQVTFFAVGLFLRAVMRTKKPHCQSLPCTDTRVNTHSTFLILSMAGVEVAAGYH